MGDLPKDVTPAILILTGIYFYPKFSFQGVSRTEFETHVGGLELKTGGPDANAQQVAVDSDEGSLKVFSRGLCFLYTTLFRSSIVHDMNYRGRY